MNKLIYLVLTTITIFAISCHYDPIVVIDSSKPCNPDTVYFKNDILPIFIANCAKSGCHDAISKKEGVQTTDYTSIMKNIKAGDLANSEHYKYMTTTSGKIMPPKPASPLSKTQLDMVAKWILQGAKSNGCNANATGCDTQNSKYSTTIKPLMEKYCTGCHNSAAPQGNINLDSYQSVAQYAKAGSLYGSIVYNASYSKMPKGGNKLDQCDIDKVKAWIDAGALND
jgi:uncharacterized membrane protein